MINILYAWVFIELTVCTGIRSLAKKDTAVGGRGAEGLWRVPQSRPINPRLTGYPRSTTDTKKPATELRAFSLLSPDLSGITGDLFGGAGGIWTPVRNYYTVGTTCLVQSLHSPVSCGWTRH